MVGDLFPPTERARIWGLILSGELIGAAFGYLVAGEVASIGTAAWRLAFIVLTIPSLGGAFAIRRWLPEPSRGGRGQLQPEVEELATDQEPVEASAVDRGQVVEDAHVGAEETAVGMEEVEAFTSGQAQEEVRTRHVAPDHANVLHADPERMDLPAAVRYVLAIRTNVVLIIASALGYFYFTGVETFGLVYFEDRFHLAHGVAILAIAPLALGGLAGVIAGGRLADIGLRRGRMNSRIVVGGWSFTLAAVFFLPGLASGSLAVALPLMAVAGFAFGARDPPLDAARLDIMHHRLWGRAEAIRTLLRQSMTASAPIVFGAIADALAPPHRVAQLNSTHGFGANANAHGIELASIVLLLTLVLGGLFTFAAKRTYPRDVATALASEEATARARQREHQTE